MKTCMRETDRWLVVCAAERALRPGEGAEPDAQGYATFGDRYPVAETDDRERAVADVLADLGAGRPMDRLIVGDVGFGKTEVALRAAFVAAMAGLQVAIVCPTTLPARQHYQNFTARFEGLPLRIGRLYPLVPGKGAYAALDGLIARTNKQIRD